MERMLVIGDAVAATGFARVLHSVLPHLVGRFEIHQIGVNYHGDPHDKPWTIYPANLGGDLHGVGRIAPLVQKLRPEVVFMHSDIWMLVRYLAALRAASSAARVVMYCAIDAGPIDAETVLELEGVDRFIVYTEFARRLVADAAARARLLQPGLVFPEVEVIAHGVDSSTFHPLCNNGCADLRCTGRREAMVRLFGDDPEMDDAFIVLNANRNQRRKRIDVTVKGFAEFARGKPANVKLHLHMGVEDLGWDVLRLSKRYGIEERLILTSRAYGLPSVPDDQLNDIYNAAVVGVNTSAGEGWGLVSFEHAATGAAQIVPRHTACEELWNGAALLLEPVATYTLEKVLADAFLVAPIDLARALDALYADPDLLRQMSAAARTRSLMPDYDWARIGGTWLELFETVAMTEI